MKPISKTAYYCCGIRMVDAETARPICGDHFARLFMNDEGLRILEAFKGNVRPNASNVARHRLIDDIVRRELSRDPRLQVVLVGAGFDSRAYRLRGGTWVELDEPQVIAYKEGRLPSSECPNALHRVAIDFSADSLTDKLAPFAGPKRVLIVIEGVLVYLEEAQIRALLRPLAAAFPRHDLVCDLMNRSFRERYSRPVDGKFTDLGATFRYVVDRPEEIFESCGYRHGDPISVIGRSFELGFLAPRGESGGGEQDRAGALHGYSIWEFQLS